MLVKTIWHMDNFEAKLGFKENIFLLDLVSSKTRSSDLHQMQTIYSKNELGIFTWKNHTCTGTPIHITKTEFFWEKIIWLSWHTSTCTKLPHRLTHAWHIPQSPQESRDLQSSSSWLHCLGCSDMAVLAWCFPLSPSTRRHHLPLLSVHNCKILPLHIDPKAS